MNLTLEQIEAKYQEKTEIEHVLDRSGTWIGSIYSDVITYLLFHPSTNKIIPVNNVTYNAGLLKLVDEILSNAVDEHRRKDSLFKITEISVDVKQDGTITIADNGGIPVVKKKNGILVPESIFGQLRTSSNYDDTQERNVVGTNGLGAKLTNIFSKTFSVQTCDGKNSVKIDWSNNMRDINKNLDLYPDCGFYIKPEENTDGKNHGTKITFKIDLERFELESLNLSTIRIIQKRCIDACATNNGLKIKFTSDIAEGKLNSDWYFESFKDYVKLFLSESEINSEILEFNKQIGLRNENILIMPSIGFNFGFVNGAICSEGTHMKKIQTQIVNKLLDICNDLDMELFTEKDITSRISIFVNTTIFNPTYESQTKEKLSNKIDKHALLFSQEFLDKLKTSEILESLKDYYHIKYAEEKKKLEKKLNKAIKTTKIVKLITCSNPNGKNNELWLFEGDSAGKGFRKHRDIQTQSAYLLRGKIRNTFNLKKEQILENKELREVMAILDLQFGDPKGNLKRLKVSKIVIASDMDYDGHHICGLLIAFFGKHFVELIKAGKIYRALSPVIIGEAPKKEKLYFYSENEFKTYEANNSIKGYEFTYTKGLGGLDDIDYKQMLRNQKLIQFTLNDQEDVDSINCWFSKANELRKQILMDDNNSEIIE